MSRTYRKPACMDECSEVRYANHAVDRYRRYKMYMDRGHRFYKALTNDQTETEYVEDSIREYRSNARDGRIDETSRNSGFKESSSNLIRTENKRLERRIMKDGDYESMPYPNSKMGKSYIWDWW